MMKTYDCQFWRSVIHPSKTHNKYDYVQNIDKHPMKMCKQLINMLFFCVIMLFNSLILFILINKGADINGVFEKKSR